MCDPTPVATTLLPAKARSSASSFDLAGAQLDPREYLWPTAARRSSGALREIFSRSKDLAGSRQLEGGPMGPRGPKENLSLSSPPIGFPKCCCEAPSQAKCNRDFPFSVRSSGKEPCTRPVGWGGAGAYGICKLLFTIKMPYYMPYSP